MWKKKITKKKRGGMMTIKIFFLVCLICKLILGNIDVYNCFDDIEDENMENFKEWVKNCHPDKWESKDITIEQKQKLNDQLLKVNKIFQEQKEQKEQQEQKEQLLQKKKKKFVEYDENEKFLFYMRLTYGLIFVILLLFYVRLYLILAILLIIFLGWKFAIILMIFWVGFYKILSCCKREEIRD